MGCAFLILRYVATFVLGVVVFFGFLFLLLLNNFSDKLLSAEFYTGTIDGENTYDRIYDEVLVDPELEETTQDLLGNIKVLSHQEMVGLLEQIVPREYLRSQVEGSIQRTVDYFNEDVEDLELYVEVGPLLENVKPVLFKYIDGRIDGLTEEDLGTPECTPQRINEVAARFEARWGDLAEGAVPGPIPSITAFPQFCRQLIFDAAFDSAVAGSGLDERARQGLRDSRQELRSAFVQGDTRGVLKRAARPLATPLMDDAIDRIKEELDGQDRLDLVRRVADWNDDMTEAELRADIDDGRDWMNSGRKFGKPLALVMLIGGTILMGLVYFPSLANGLRWPGLTLLFTGIVFFVVGKVLESRVPDWLRELVERGAEDVAGIPASVTSLGGDLLVSFGKQLTGGFAAPSLTLLIIGALLFGASFFVFIVKPFIPGVK